MKQAIFPMVLGIHSSCSLVDASSRETYGDTDQLVSCHKAQLHDDRLPLLGEAAELRHVPTIAPEG